MRILNKALIVYGTRYGATANTSDEIAQVLRKEGLQVRVVNAKEEKVKDIAEYSLVIVGSGIRMGRWTGEAENFLQKFKKDLSKKKVALFVCCGSASEAPNGQEEKPDAIDSPRRKYLEEKAAKYSLQPVALGFFGGVYDYKMSFWIRRGWAALKRKVELAGFKETRPGVYDTRDWNAIRSWAKELATSEKLRSATS
jgi:menaquinone-dependent protoporphyrinogen oxidase